MSLLIPGLLLLFTVPLVVMLVRANELFVLRLRAGGARVVRGRIPQRFVNDLVDAVASDDRTVTLRGVSEDGRVRLYPSGDPLSDAERQRLRNVAAMWPVVRVRNG